MVAGAGVDGPGDDGPIAHADRKLPDPLGGVGHRQLTPTRRPCSRGRRDHSLPRSEFVMPFSLLRRAHRWLTRPRPCSACKCWPLGKLVGGRCHRCVCTARPPRTATRAARVFVSAHDVRELLASGGGSIDARRVEIDTEGAAVLRTFARVARIGPEPTPARAPRPRKSRKSLEAPAPRARVRMPVTLAEERRALEMLATRRLHRMHLVKRRCLPCRNVCRCEWRSRVWIELVNPFEGIETPADFGQRVDRAVWRAEEKQRRQWEAEGPTIRGDREEKDIGSDDF